MTAHRSTPRHVAGFATAAALAGALAAHAALPPGWTVHTYTGRIHEIEPAGGVLACATDGGLLFFDPSTRSFGGPVADAGCTDGNCLTSNRLTSVSRDASGAYWIGTEASGAVVYRPGASGREYGRFFTRNAAAGGGLLADSVSCIEAWKSETVYVGTSQGVGQIDLAGGVDSYTPDAARRLGTDIPGTRIHDLAVDSLYVWVATDSGVSRYDRDPPYAVEALPDSLLGPGTFTVEILGGTVYAGTSIGVFTWRETEGYWKRVRKCATCSGTTPDAPALGIARLSTGRLLVGSETTVYTFNGSTWGPLAPPTIYLLGGRRFRAIAASGDTVWTCQQNADGEGGYLDTWSIASPTWVRHEPNAVPPSEVRAVGLATNGDLWIGTLLAGVARLAATSGVWCIWNGNDPTVRANMTVPEGFVSALLVDRGGTAWFHAMPQPPQARAVDRLVPSADCVHSGDTWSHVQPGQNRFLGRYWRALEDGEGNRYFLSDGETEDGSGGFDVLSADEQLVANLRADTLGGSIAGALAFETASGPWERAYVGLNGLGTEGLKLWNRARQLFPPGLPSPANFTTLSLPDSVAPDQFRDIVVASANARRLWVGTDWGVFEYDAIERRVLTVLRVKRGAKPGLLSGDVKDLQFDDFGNLWVATVKGLNRLRLADWDRQRQLGVDAYTTIETIRDRNASSSAGELYDPRRALAPLPAAKVNSLAYDAARDRLVLGTEGGVALVDVAGLSVRAQLPLADATIYPNPVRIDAGHREVHIAHVSEPVSVSIYTVEGELVCEVTDRDDRSDSRSLLWTLGTPSCLEGEGNYEAASGVYLVRITSAAGESTLRTLVVIR